MRLYSINERWINHVCESKFYLFHFMYCSQKNNRSEWVLLFVHTLYCYIIKDHLKRKKITNNFNNQMEFMQKSLKDHLKRLLSINNCVLFVVY